MSAAAPNHVRELREARGLSQVELAAAAGLTRQSVGAIEAARATPAVDVALRLARALGCSVEALFAAADSDTLQPTPTAAAPPGTRLALAFIAGRWLSYPLLGQLPGDRMRISADAIATAGPACELLRPGAEARDNLVVTGCAGALGLLTDRLNAHPGAGRFLWFAGSSTDALAALAAARTHVAGVHLIDDRSGEANVPDVRRHAGAATIVLITLGRWEAGLLTAAGNPKRIRGAAELARRGLRIAAREPGSGARRLLEREWTRAGHGTPLPAATIVRSHLAVAESIAHGSADVGLATRDVAILHGLHFIPLAEERYDLAIPLTAIEDPRIQRMFDAMTSAPLRRELGALGYDVSRSGDRVAEVRAA